MTEQQELEAVLKHLKMTEKEFDFLCEAAYNKVIKKKIERDNPAKRGDL